MLNGPWVYAIGNRGDLLMDCWASSNRCHARQQHCSGSSRNIPVEILTRDGDLYDSALVTRGGVAPDRVPHVYAIEY